MAAPNAPAKPAGKGLNGKIGPVPVKVVIFAVVALGVWLYLRHRGKTSSTSAGSEAVQDQVPLTYPSGDATGSGSGSSGGGDSSTPPATYPAAPTPFNFYFGPNTQGGGNTSPPAVASTPTATPFEEVTQQDPNLGLVRAAAVAAGNAAAHPTLLPFNPGSYVKQPGLSDTLQPGGKVVNLEAGNKVTKPPSSANYGGGSAPSKKQITARNKKQAA